MKKIVKEQRVRTRTKAIWPLIFLVASISCSATKSKDNKAEASGAQSFATPELAVAELQKAVENKDRDALIKIFGSNSEGLLVSGDAVQDKSGFEEFAARLKEQHKLEAQSSDSYILLIGAKQWPFPMPIVAEDKEWVFDTETGREEILDRRIGENELKTIRFVRSYVEAQREYFRKDRDGDRIKEFAEKAISAPGKQDGLFWKSDGGKEESPLGPLAAEAASEGYKRKEGEAVPYHGYFFKILKEQGQAADGGAKKYIDSQGGMTGGFGLLAYPARWESSGIMSFIVNQDGVVYQKDLGVQTLAEAEALNQFNPDESWEPVADPNEDVLAD